MQPISCYEKLRQQNMARNQLFLRELGLETVALTIPESRSRRPKRKIETNDHVEGVRRSSRVANFPALISYIEVNESKVISSFKAEKDTYLKRSVLSDTRLQPSADSSRAINANLDVFFGAIDDVSSSNDNIVDRGILGEMVESYGKAAVMAISNSGVQPKFSKYSGVCEWKNCVFLWVNIMKESCKGNYSNTFNEKGRFMTWFGGSKMSEDSAVVQRLLAVPSVDTLRQLNNEGNPNIADEGDTVIEPKSEAQRDSVILFVRIEGENYACLGRVAHISYNLRTQPIEFEWELLDFERIKDKPTFKRISQT